MSWKWFGTKLQQPDATGLSLNYRYFIAYISPKCLGIVVGVPLLNFLENISSFSGSGRALLSKMIILMEAENCSGHFIIKFNMKNKI